MGYSLVLDCSHVHCSAVEGVVVVGSNYIGEHDSPDGERVITQPSVIPKRRVGRTKTVVRVVGVNVRIPGYQSCHISTDTVKVLTE